jgi:hypothetical protein
MAQLSVAAAVGAPAPKTLCLAGDLQGQPISILVDSGSSHTFLSTKIGSSLPHLQQLQPSLAVQVANGEILQCTHHIPQAVWSIQGCSFTTDLKILPLQSYDMILGLDWLSSFSPMQIH